MTGSCTPAFDADALAGLLRPAGHPLDPSAEKRLERIQTHLSWVFLTGERVYKFRKPVDLGFVRFVSQAERNTDCLREVELNRRLAPDVYLGVAPLLGRGRRARIGPVSERLVDGAEHCVVMRRLEEGRDALSMLAAGRLRGEHLDHVARRLAHFHRAQSLESAPYSAPEWYERCIGPFHDCLGALGEGQGELVPRARLQRVSELASRFEGAHADRFEHRRIEGRAVDGHGDLHLEHVWFEDESAEPIAIDCLEFSQALRHIDAASEVAFLAMDLTYREAEGLAERFLREYAAASDDFGLYAVVDYFVAYRAAVRAKVAAIAAGDLDIDPAQRERAASSARCHLDLALRALEHRRPGAIAVVGGAVGTGKSSVADALADALHGVVIASDRVRKHGLGLQPTERAPREAYAPKARSAVYDALLERAAPVVESGRTVVLDATFGRAEQRAAVLERARALGVSAFFIEVCCDRDIAVERLERRRAQGSVSDAGPELHPLSLAGFQPPTDWPETQLRKIDTGDGSWRVAIAPLARWIRDREDGIPTLKGALR